jgi:hypothetical protein
MAQLSFSGNQLTAPVWAGDFLNREHLLPGGAKLDKTQFNAADAVVVTVATGGAAQAATTIPVAALSGPIPNGTVLRFSIDEFARLTAAAAAGATSLAVEALVNAVEAGDVATYAGSGAKKKVVKSGTLIGRTYTERANNTAFGPAADADDEVYLVAFDVDDVDRLNDVDLYRHGGLVKENLLPVFFALSSTLQGKIRTLYQTTTGRA